MSLRRLLDQAVERGDAPPVLTGLGLSDRLPELLDTSADRILVVASRACAVRSRGVTRLIEAGAHLHQDIRPNPTMNEALTLSGVIDAIRPERVVAVGGGSTIDLAKAARVLVAEPAAEQMRLHAGSADRPPGWPSLVAVPTTAGTGSEVTPFATLYRNGQKVSVDAPEVRPDLVVLDGSLVRTCPPGVALAAVLDALCHAVESEWNNHSTAPSRHYASTASHALVELLAHGPGVGDDQCDEALLIAATIAGIAIAQTRTTAAHAFSYWLTAKHEMPHGFACALSLSWLASYTWVEAHREHGAPLDMLNRLGCGPDADVESPVAVLSRLVADATRVGLIQAPRLADAEIDAYVVAGMGVGSRAGRHPVPLVADRVRDHIDMSQVFNPSPSWRGAR